jgi:hypothetical protein
MLYVARFSTGSASAVATDLVINEVGRNKVLIRFEDVSWEDEDNYRFKDDCMKRWGGKCYVGKVGKTPLQIAEEKMIIPNDRMAPCSRELKIKPFEEWLWKLPKPVTIIMGLGPLEPHRIERIIRWHKVDGNKWRRPQGFAARIPGVYEDFPLVRHKIYGGHQDIVRSWGIEPPRLYKYGMSHANCGARCVRQGISEWKRLWQAFPERFKEMADWEEAQRAKGGARANASFSRSRVGGKSSPITLYELEKRWKSEQASYSIFDVAEVAEVPDDQGSCFCTDT